MTIYIKRCLIVTASQQKFAQDLCEALAGEVGKGMFTSGASASGELPATHFINEGCLEDTFAAALSDPAYLHGACQQAGLPITLPQCTALLESSDVSTDNPFDALARLGLQLVLLPLP